MHVAEAGSLSDALVWLSISTELVWRVNDRLWCCFRPTQKRNAELSSANHRYYGRSLLQLQGIETAQQTAHRRDNEAEPQRQERDWHHSPRLCLLRLQHLWSRAQGGGLVGHMSLRR